MAEKDDRTGGKIHLTLPSEAEIEAIEADGLGGPKLYQAGDAQS